MIQPLDFPKADLRLKKRDGIIYVWCVLRKKDLVCTPEEWVRQHLIHFLIASGYPAGLLASEVALEYNGRKKRADVVVFDRRHQPRMIVECKAPDIPLSEEVLYQIAAYNKALQVEFLVMTNGLRHIFARIDPETGDLEFLAALPEFTGG